jgi:hypothetical protein
LSRHFVRSTASVTRDAGDYGSISFISADGYRTSRSVPPGFMPAAVALSPGGAILYVTADQQTAGQESELAAITRTRPVRLTDEGGGRMLYVLALSRSAFVIRHWFEINLDDASMEHGVRVELREMPAQPHRGTESAAQVVMLDRPLWRADLFDRLAEAPGAFGAAHFHPRFDGNEPCARVWDARLTADPWGWLGDQVANAGAVSGHGPWPVNPADAAEIRELAGTVVAAARPFEASQCASAADCYRQTRDVRDTVRLMIATLTNPGLLDTAWVAPWTG